MSFQYKVAIVTGGGSGIGKAICKKLYDDGASVVVADISLDGADKVVSELAGNNGNAIGIKVDVTKSKETEEMTQKVLDKFGKIDILVNNVGGTPREKGGLFHELEEGIWDWQIDLNLKSVRNCTRSIIGHMIERKAGKIVNIASVAGVKGTPSRVEYSTAKAGVIGFTIALAKEVAQFNINVNSVSPGPVETPLLKAASLERRENLLNSLYIKRFGEPWEIAEMVAYLASESADFITGQNYIVDGGRTL